MTALQRIRASLSAGERPADADVREVCADAGRFAWLRDHQAYVAVARHYSHLPKVQRTGWTIRLINGNDDDFTAAIDAAIREPK